MWWDDISLRLFCFWWCGKEESTQAQSTRFRLSLHPCAGNEPHFVVNSFTVDFTNLIVAICISGYRSGKRSGHKLFLTAYKEFLIKFCVSNGYKIAKLILIVP